MAHLVRHRELPVAPSIALSPPSTECLQTAGLPQRPRSRAKFSAEEREKVLGVRRQGACLRCRMLKIQCSLENPCQPCLQSAVRGSERKVLSFCYCVRTRFADVNIFETPSPGADGDSSFNMQTETLMQMMSGLLSRIATPASFSLISDPAVFNNTMVSWLTDPNFHLPGGSIVGLCCSSLLGLQFEEESAGADGLTDDFRRFLLATSLAHSGWRDPKSITTRDLCAAGQISGCRLIKRLDRILTPQFLARCGRESCQVLFLLVLGAVLGVGYSLSQLEDHSPSFPSEMLSPELQRSPTLWLAMKEHLCQMLAHHLIFVGSMLGIKLDTGLEQCIIETAVNRWNKAESFVWADVVVFDERKGAEHAVLEEGVESSGSSGSSEFGAKEVGEEALMETKVPLQESMPPLPPLGPRLVPIPCQDVAGFQPQALDHWSENPQSYLSMFDKPENCGLTSPETAAQAEKSPIVPSETQSNSGLRFFEPAIPEVKRRKIWIVRPFDAGPEYGPINVHARLQGGRGMESLRAFV